MGDLDCSFLSCVVFVPIVVNTATLVVVVRLISMHGNLWFVVAIGCSVNWLTLPIINFLQRGGGGGAWAFESKCNQLLVLY